MQDFHELTLQSSRRCKMSNALYYLADPQAYKQGKINILSAKSNVLKSREITKHLAELMEDEDKLKLKVAKNAAKIRVDLKKFIETLPKQKDQILEKEKHKYSETPTKKSKKEEKKEHRHKDEIKAELDDINRKLAELGAL